MQEMYQGATGLRQRIAQLSANPNAQAIAIGVTALALTPVVLPLVKPVLKATIKSGVTLFEKAKVAVAETGEMVADIAAEAKAEALTEAQKRASLKSAISTPQLSPNQE
ncbi:MAG: DUF5132 domain-containing protein [Arthrospira sp. SH-MAG29]|nr:DUF5132 domain-containing protein [Arthrospira sp. SH-MAG29]MBS0015491.1 DUF5132 domain-containing protein [Arthrospira sp. SH-MAG29]